VTNSPHPHDCRALTEQVESLLEKASSGDEAAMRKLKTGLPQYRDLFLEHYGNLAQRAQDLMIIQHTGNDLLEAEALRLLLEDFKAELAGPHASPLENVIIQRISCAWLHAQLADMAAARPTMDRNTEAYLQKAQTEADKRLFRAVRSLAQVRKILTRITPLY
jgi:hypothetical protein